MHEINRGNSFNTTSEKTKPKKARTVFGELDKGRKIAVIFLAFFSVFLFVAWGITAKKRVSDSFNYNTNYENTEDEDVLNHYSDKDGDGLTDWEEEEFYNTSPYLEDTDGDGISDLSEIDYGTDPNCKEGENCSVADSLAEQEKKDIEINQFIDENIDLNVEAESELINSESIQEAFKGNSSADDLRKMLIEAGMDVSLLESISDEELLNSYQEILQ